MARKVQKIGNARVGFVQGRLRSSRALQPTVKRRWLVPVCFSDSRHIRLLCPWLNNKHMEKIKHLRKLCSELNDAAAAASGNRAKPFVVIAGVLNKRQKDGKAIQAVDM